MVVGTVPEARKRSLFQTDDDHAAWKLYRLLNGLPGPSGRENHAARERCKLEFKKNKKQKQTVHQETGDMMISNERQQHYDSVSVFTCSMACPTAKDM